MLVARDIIDIARDDIARDDIILASYDAPLDIIHGDITMIFMISAVGGIGKIWVRFEFRQYRLPVPRGTRPYRAAVT